MSKPHKTIQPEPVSAMKVAAPVDDFVGFLHSVVAPDAALETLDATPSGRGRSAPENGGMVLATQSESQEETTVILRKGSSYYVYFNTDELLSAAWWGSNLDSFTRWAMSLSSDDVVYFHQTGYTHVMPYVVQALVVIDTMCQAKTIFVVDHIIESPLFLLVCKDFVIEDTGALLFANYVQTDANRREKIFRPYLVRLYGRAVQKGLLTEQEAKSVLVDNAMIFKTARDLRVLAAAK